MEQRGGSPTPDHGSELSGWELEHGARLEKKSEKVNRVIRPAFGLVVRIGKFDSYRLWQLRLEQQMRGAPEGREPELAHVEPRSPFCVEELEGKGGKR